MAVAVVMVAGGGGGGGGGGGSAAAAAAATKTSETFIMLHLHSYVHARAHVLLTSATSTAEFSAIIVSADHNHFWNMIWLRVLQDRCTIQHSPLCVSAWGPCPTSQT